MTLNILFAAPSSYWPDYAEPLAEACAGAGLTVSVSRDHAPAEVDYIVYAPESGLDDFTPFARCKAVLSLWAGVEKVVTNPTLTQPLARMVDEGLTEGMTEWVTGHVLRHHLGMDAHIVNPEGLWAPAPPPLARDRPVTILGLGTLGRAAAEALAALNFPVTGWSASAKDIPGVTCHSGADGLARALSRAEILVLLLPLTADTERLLDAARLAALPKGAVILNPGRGGLIDDTALLAALDTGQVAHATLDTFREEPLPPDHPFWSDPKVTVTPHIASETRPATAVLGIARNIAGVEAGQPLQNRVDRGSGY